MSVTNDFVIFLFFFLFHFVRSIVDRIPFDRMGTRAPKFNGKRHCADDSDQRPVQRKCRRVPSKSQQRLAKSHQKSATKITNLDDDCLLNIFERLDMGSLFNVAVANEYLRPAAGIAYKKLLAERPVFIVNGDYHYASVPFVYGSNVLVINLKTVLQLLRCLGSTIGHFKISYSEWSAKQCDHIHQYLNKYCAPTLDGISLFDLQPNKPIKHIEKPFVNVRDVVVRDSDLGAQFTSFSDWFPNVCSLTLDGVRIHPFCSIEKPFPHLVDVCIHLNNHERDFAKDFAVRLLQQCPQLQKLHFRIRNGEQVNMKALLKITERFQSIRHLKVNTVPHKTRATLTDVRQLVNAHPSLVQLQLYGYKLSVGAVNMLTSQLNSLDQFQFQIDDQSKYGKYVSRLDGQWRPSLTVEHFERILIDSVTLKR